MLTERNRAGLNETMAMTAYETVKADLVDPGPARNRIELGPDLEESQIIRSAVGDLSEDLPGMAREMPARAMRLGPSPWALRHPLRCALDVYTRHGLWWLPCGNDMRQIASDHSVCSLQRQGRRAALSMKQMARTAMYRPV